MSEFPSAQDFCVNVPMYTFYPVNEGNFEQFLAFCVNVKSIDNYCMECCKTSTFRIYSNSYAQGRTTLDNWATWNRYLTLSWKCTRNDEHEIIYTFKFDVVRGVQKVGQYPSSHDVTLPSLKKFKKVLGLERHRELVKAVGLHAHGVGAGSLIYLRRIFEALIEESHAEALRSEDWKNLNEEKFGGMRIAEKIQALKHYLPEFLVGNPKIYSVLSKGVHSTPEDECLKYFPIMRLAIESILIQKMAEVERKKNESDITRFLSSVDNM